MSPKLQAAIEKASRLVAETYYGDRGRWLCDAFEAINQTYFFGELPYPHLVLELTAHGRCLAWCQSSDQTPPTIALHPSLFGGTEREDPWDIPAAWLGKRFAFDSLLHECIHASVHYRLGGWEGESSHNNPVWIEEVNRLAPLVGFRNVEAAVSKPTRVPIPGKFTKRGKPKTKVQRVSEGNIPFQAAATFPTGLRMHRKTAEQHYSRGRLPVKISSRA